MLVREGPTRNLCIDRNLAWSFAGIAGALNAAGFCAFGSFSSNMTGNVSTLADHLGLGELIPALQAVAIVATFMTGALSATLLISAGRRHHLPGVYAYSVLVEATLLIGLGVLGMSLPASGQGFALTFGLSFLLGLQNATVTQITDARVRTTHVTGMVTDLGIGLGHLFARRGLADPGPDRDRMKLYGVTVAAFLTGGVIGVVAWRLMGLSLLLIAGGLLALIALPGIYSARRAASSRNEVDLNR